MTWGIPEYLKVPAEGLGKGGPVQVRVLSDMHSIADDMAREMMEILQRARMSNRQATLIVPVGPVDQFPLLAQRINDARMDCREVLFINMDEYLTDEDRWIPLDHPLSFRAFMDRKFYSHLDPELAPRTENRVFPAPGDEGAIARLIDQRGGVDACFGGIGINGHIAFNEPPEPGEECSLEEFAALPTRILSLSRETRTINSVTVGGDIQIVPRRCITVGMREILAARKLRFYCNRPWQRGVVRRVLHGPISAACPASLLRLHQDAALTVADYVAEAPDVQLR